jgi:secondary thiamine-phosphate synthase enzyme
LSEAVDHGSLCYGAVQELTITTERRTQLLDITDVVRDAVRGADGAAVLVYVPHTTAGLTINEHADPMVARDFEMALEKIAPEGWGWQHIEEGEENAPSHIRAALMGPQVVIPLRDGELALGTWQGIFFCELDGPRTRSLYVTVLQ